ncbi:MAG: sensor histidine kinase [Acidimicrobiia bacterium]
MRSTRTRILLWAIALLALSAVASVVAMRHLLLLRLDERIERQMRQEVGELRILAGGNDPQTGLPFGTDLRAVFDVYFARSISEEGEEVLGIVAGQPYKVTGGPNYPLHELPEVETWSALTASVQGRADTPEGEVRYLAVPVVIESQALGAFVVANYPAGAQAEINDAVQVAALVSASVLILASLVAFAVAGRVLAPLRELSRTARSITETDMARRIPERGNDELAELARTFNAMLGRLESGFANQRAFIDDAGHELRTPITIIRGHLELAGDDPVERAETLHLVLDELDRMARIVDDLLLLAKAEQPDFVNPRPLDLAELTEELIAKARTLGNRRWEIDRADPGVVVADRHRLTQAIMNLVRNAVQHTDDGDVVAVGSAVSNGRALLWVRDSGSGVLDADRERIFQRFARGSGSARLPDEGAGLGLAIAQAILDAHGGRIELSSRPGEGATFTLILPTDRLLTTHSAMYPTHPARRGEP